MAYLGNMNKLEENTDNLMRKKWNKNVKEHLI